MTWQELRDRFDAVWLVDFEFHQPDGDRPQPVCLVAKEWFTGRTISQWRPAAAIPPYEIGSRALLVSFYSTAELTCHLALGWPVPVRLIDLYAEFRLLVCGLEVPCGHGLLGALAYFGLPGLEAAAKEDMRDLAIRGGPYSQEERDALLQYCESDVVALKNLWEAMMQHIDLLRALIRGQYLAALSRIEWNGIPIDTVRHGALQAQWAEVKLALIARIDRAFGVYDGESFKLDRFKQWLAARGISWPVLESGQLALDGDTFREMANTHPELGPLKELRATLGQLHLNEIAIGRDGRTRCMLSPFASRTGRNQPSNTKFIFGPAVWIRHLIKPAPGYAIAYVDWEQQEFGIAASLSGDIAMMQAYRSGDPYLAFAKQAGAVPTDATRQSHKGVRDLYKICALAVQFGMGESSLGEKLGLTPAHGRELIAKHQAAYPRYWRWSEAVQDQAMFYGSLTATFGWRVQVGRNPNPRSLRNFPVQANGAEMLRLAIILADQRGVKICAPVHDALLIEARIEDIDQAVTTCQKAMADASELVLPGFPLRTDATIFRDPGHYRDDRGEKIWQEIWSISCLQSELIRAGNVKEELFHP